MARSSPAPAKADAGEEPGVEHERRHGRQLAKDVGDRHGQPDAERVVGHEARQQPDAGQQYDPYQFFKLY